MVIGTLDTTFDVCKKRNKHGRLSFTNRKMSNAKWCNKQMKIKNLFRLEIVSRWEWWRVSYPWRHFFVSLLSNPPAALLLLHLSPVTFFSPVEFRMVLFENGHCLTVVLPTPKIDSSFYWWINSERRKCIGNKSLDEFEIEFFPKKIKDPGCFDL